MNVFQIRFQCVSPMTAAGLRLAVIGCLKHIFDALKPVETNHVFRSERPLPVLWATFYPPETLKHMKQKVTSLGKYPPVYAVLHTRECCYRLSFERRVSVFHPAVTAIA
jgi:hypothetical protein